MGLTAAAIEFQTGDGITLRGLQWSGGSEWLIFAHDRDGESDLDSWRPLISVLGTGGWSMLAFDLRGHGASEGVWTASSSDDDLQSAIGFARSQGAAWIAVLAAGQSAVTALKAAPDTALDALVLLSPSITGKEPGDSLRGKGEAKLFAAGGKDVALQHAVSQLRNRSIGWAMLVTVPTDAQGTTLLSDEHAGQVRERIVAFLTEQRFLARTRGIPSVR